MLAQLLAIMDNRQTAMSLAELSRAVEAQPSAVLAMIELLVARGKLFEIGPDGRACRACGQQSDCNLLSTLGKRYVLAARLREAPDAPVCACSL